jgi:hypothetical protein
MDMRFDTWNVKKFVWGRFTIDSIKKLSIYKLDLVGMQEVRLKSGGTKLSGEYTF